MEPIPSRSRRSRASDSTLSILMSCHGAILPDTTVDDLKLIILPAPKDVTISKLNVGPFGDFACSIASYRTIQESATVTRNLLHGIDTYCTEDRVSKYKAKTRSDKYINRTRTIKGQTIPDIRCSEGSHVTQTNSDFYVKKHYEPDSTMDFLKYFWISHTTTTECLNIFFCTQDEFIHFFGELDEHDRINVQQFFENRDAGPKPVIRTDEMYLIIELAKKYLSTKVVNIVDESCNFIPCGIYDDKGHDIGVRCKYGEDGDEKIAIILSELPPNTTYGGTRRAKICI